MERSKDQNDKWENLKCDRKCINNENDFHNHRPLKHIKISKE